MIRFTIASVLLILTVASPNEKGYQRMYDSNVTLVGSIIFVIPSAHQKLLVVAGEYPVQRSIVGAEWKSFV